MAGTSFNLRFGLDHYYLIELFTNDSQGNPLTFDVRELPPGFPQTGQLYEPVCIAGFTAALWLAVWRWNRSGQKFHKQVLERFGGAAATSLNDAGFDHHGRPDFSHLE
jgi:hypothetical protein